MTDSLPLLHCYTARKSIFERIVVYKRFVFGVDKRKCRKDLTLKHGAAICSLKRHPYFHAKMALVFIHKLHKKFLIEFGQNVNCQLGK